MHHPPHYKDTMDPQNRSEEMLRNVSNSSSKEDIYAVEDVQCGSLFCSTKLTADGFQFLSDAHAFDSDRCVDWTFRCILNLPCMQKKKKNQSGLCLQYFQFQTFLLFSFKLISLVLFLLLFWRENSFLCLPLSQMSHSTEPVTMLGLRFAGCGSPWQPHCISASHTYISKPSSFRNWIFFFIQSTLSFLLPFYLALSGKDKGDIFSVKRSVKFSVWPPWDTADHQAPQTTVYVCVKSCTCAVDPCDSDSF